MAKLSEIMNIETLESLISEGYISRKYHKEFPLAILNYTHRAQYEPNLVWGEEMSWSRGLIYNTETFEIVSTPFKKFWNFSDSRHPETLEENLPSDIPLITTKMDGSLIILYTWEGQNYCATRGSFESDQAKWATNWLQTNYPRLEPIKGYTLLFECIYNENRIVISYDFEGLIVLGAVSNETGTELSRSNLKSYCTAMGLTLVKDHRKDLLTCKSEDISNEEGYVATYANGLKIKIKFENYCQLHRIVTGLNPRSIWELKRDGKYTQITDWLLDPKMPEEFKSWLEKWNKQLCIDYEDILLKAETIFSSTPKNLSRKETALFFLNEDNKKYAKLLFALLDGHSIAPLILKMIEPKATDTFRADGE